MSIEVPDCDAVIYGGPDRKGNEVFKEGKVIGYVTKFTYGFTWHRGGHNDRHDYGHINAIPYVVAAEPGIRTVQELPMTLPHSAFRSDATYIEGHKICRP